jgi:hypothetical protein
VHFETFLPIFCSFREARELNSPEQTSAFLQFRDFCSAAYERKRNRAEQTSAFFCLRAETRVLTSVDIQAATVRDRDSNIHAS